MLRRLAPLTDGRRPANAQRGSGRPPGGPVTVVAPCDPRSTVSHPDQPTSGSRWEPATRPAPQPGFPPAAQPGPAADERRAATAGFPAASEAVAPAATPAGATARPVRRRRARRAGPAAAAAAALLVAGGLGGFAVGTATAGDGTVATSTTATQDGLPGLDDGDGVPDGRPDLGGRGLPPDTGGSTAVPPGTTGDGAASGTATDEGDPA
jgi:hypothetical protein